MKALKIAVDLDNTINDFTDKFGRFVNEYGYNFDWRNKFNSYFIQKCILDEKAENIFQKIMNDGSFWLSLSLLEDVKTTLEKINERYTLSLVTAPFSKNKKHIEAKKLWVRKTLPFIQDDQLIFEYEKWNLNCDLIIDDRPETIEKCNESNMITFAPRYSYNALSGAYFYFEEWKHVFSKILKVEKALLTN